jgi:hypothetical protein
LCGGDVGALLLDELGELGDRRAVGAVGVQGQRLHPGLDRLDGLL